MIATIPPLFVIALCAIVAWFWTNLQSDPRIRPTGLWQMAGDELPRRPEGTASLKAEICHAWRPVDQFDPAAVMASLHAQTYGVPARPHQVWATRGCHRMTGAWPVVTRELADAA